MPYLDDRPIASFLIATNDVQSVERLMEETAVAIKEPCGNDGIIWGPIEAAPGWAFRTDLRSYAQLFSFRERTESAAPEYSAVVTELSCPEVYDEFVVVAALHIRAGTVGKGDLRELIGRPPDRFLRQWCEDLVLRKLVVQHSSSTGDFVDLRRPVRSSAIAKLWQEILYTPTVDVPLLEWTSVQRFVKQFLKEDESTPDVVQEAPQIDQQCAIIIVEQLVDACANYAMGVPISVIAQESSRSGCLAPADELEKTLRSQLSTFQKAIREDLGLDLASTQKGNDIIVSRGEPMSADCSANLAVMSRARMARIQQASAKVMAAVESPKSREDSPK